MTLDPVAIATGVGPVLSDPRQQHEPNAGTFDAVFAEAQGADDAPSGEPPIPPRAGPEETPWASLVWTPGALELDAPTPAGVVATVSSLTGITEVSLAAPLLPSEAAAPTAPSAARSTGQPGPQLDANAEGEALEAMGDAQEATIVTEAGPVVEDLLGEDAGQRLHKELLTREPAQGGQGALPSTSSPRAQAAQQPVDMVAAAMEPPPELVPTPASDRVVRLKLDRDLEVQIATRDQHVDVLLRGDMKRVEALLAVGPELRAELDRAGFTLGDLSGRDQGGANAQGGGHERAPSSPRATPAGAQAAAQVVAPAPVRHDGLVSALA